MGGGLNEQVWDVRLHAEHWPWVSCDGGNGSGWWTNREGVWGG